MTRSVTALHVGHTHHQPWCRIYHNPAMTAECWCDAQIAATAYKLGVAEGLAMAALRFRHDEAEGHRVNVTEQTDQDESHPVLIDSPRPALP